MVKFIQPVVGLARRTVPALLLLLLARLAAAQVLPWQSATAVSGSATATATDAAGNVYVAGSFTGTLSVAGVTLTSAGATDVFVAKYRPGGSPAWVQRAGGAGPDEARALVVSGAGVYVAGTSTGGAAFGSTTLPGAATAAVGFVAKLADAGSSAGFVWAQAAGQEARALAVQGSGVFVAGNFAGTATFGSTTLTSTGFSDMFVARLTDAGAASSYAWVQRSGGPDFEGATALAATPAGAVYVAGYYVGRATFGPTALANAGSYDVFVAKIQDNATSGAFAWALPAGGPGADQALALAANGTSVYVAGSYLVAATFGALSLGNGTAGDAFVAKVTDAGASAAYTWAQRAGGPGTDAAQALAVAGADVYVAGAVGGAAQFGALAPAFAGGYDVFVAKLTDAGAAAAYAWAQTAGGAGNDSARALAFAPGVPGGGLYVVGAASPPAAFGALALGGAAGRTTSFVALLAAQPLATASVQALAAGVSLYPNPASGRVTVQLPAIPGAPTATIALLDALGRILRTQASATHHKTELDLTGIAPGLYAVRVAAGGRSATQRLVVE